MDFSFLQELGLTHNESMIYQAVLKLGSAPSGRITYETGLHRSRVYEGLNRLAEKGLVSFIKKGSTTHFEATSSEKIVDVLEEEKTQLEEKIQQVKRIIPQLNQYRETKPTAEAYILQGVEGFKAMRRDALKHAKNDILLIGAIARENEVMPAFFENWDRERQQKKILLRTLYKSNAKGKSLLARQKLAEYRYLPSYISNPAVINVYGDRVVNVLWKENFPLCFMMVNQEMADAYRKYFDLLWKDAEK